MKRREIRYNNINTHRERCSLPCCCIRMAGWQEKENKDFLDLLIKRMCSIVVRILRIYKCLIAIC